MDQHEEQALYLGDKAGERLFAVLHRPERPRASYPTVVICAPFAWEKVKAHRCLVVLARHLNNHGFTALRFDYQGQGDSEGEFTEETFERMTEDAVRAARWVQKQAPGSPLALLGLRLGSTVAAAAGARLGNDLPLLLWEPVVGLRDYLYDYLRMNLADQSMMYKEIRFDRDQLVQQILAGEEVRVDGFVFSKPLWQGAEEVTLERFLAQSEAPCLLVQIDRGKKPKPPRKELRPLLEAHFGDRPGRELVHTLCSSLFWLQFTFHRPHEPELFDLTQTWLESQIGNEAEERKTKSKSVVPVVGSSGRSMRPVSFFGQDGVLLRGIFHPGTPERSDTCLVMLNSGLLPRYCYHRHYVKLARYLAPLGISVLRYDASGLGDAEGDLAPARVEKHWHAIQRGFHVPDARAAIAFARQELGAKRVLLVGACGGATTALLTAAADPAALDLDSCILIAMPVVFSDPEGDQGALHPFEAEQVLQSYWRKLTNPRALLRLLAGRSDYRLIFESVYRPLQRRIADLLGRPQGGASQDQGQEDRPSNYNLHLEQAFGRYIRAGGRVLIVMARFDRETADFEQSFEPSVLGPGNPFQGSYRLIKVEGASHTFAEAGKEELLFEEVKAWIAQRIGVGLDGQSHKDMKMKTE